MSDSSHYNLYRMPNAYATIESELIAKVPVNRRQTDGQLSALKKPHVVVVEVQDFDALERAVKDVRANLSGDYTAILVGKEEKHVVSFVL